jgi:uncharacterized membrane protein (DUF373 family)
MERINRLKAHYNFTVDDAKNLERLRPWMEGYREDFVAEFYNHVKNFEDANKFLKDDETIGRHKEGLKKWFVNLFSGEYGVKYFNELEHIGLSHVNVRLNAHYVNAAMHFVKRYVMGLLERAVKERSELPFVSRSVEKIIDINLDVITSAYVALGALVIGLFAYDLTHLFEGDIEKGLLSTMGSLLMLWVVIELIDNEIRQLRGGRFAIKVFISVAMVAVIRKILVTTLAAEAIGAQISLIAAVAVLGVVYWLISKVEQ